MLPPQFPTVNDVTQLNPVPVWAVIAPKTIDEIAEALARTEGPVSIGGGRYSMGGQTASFGSLHIDMRAFNKVINFSPLAKTIRVQTGIRWRDIQRFIDPHDMSVKIMQSYANFTVGGSLSVNVHGRYMGLGPLALAVRSIRIVLADGSIRDASPTDNAELFYGAIGGYGGLGVIVEAELDLVPNQRVRRLSAKMSRENYAEHFRSKVFTTQRGVFHNADLYPPSFERVRSVTWVETDKWVTHEARMQSSARSYPLHRYMVWAISETPWGKWRREYLIDPLLYLRSHVHWRNFEASYDVNELEPASRQQSTFVLQEYFVPAARFDEFVPRMAEILQRFNVNAINVSVRHSVGDPGTLLAWARGETFAFVLYYKQRTRDVARSQVAIWTRELIDAAISVGGAYYLPYQIHATREQFLAAYPRAGEFFALKARLDPAFRFRNTLWDTYYRPPVAAVKALPAMAPPMAAEPLATGPAAPSEFRRVLSEPLWHDAFYRFLQNIYRLYPEDQLHHLLCELSENHPDDEAIYRNLLRGLSTLKPRLAPLRFGLPALARQKAEMRRQTRDLLNAIGRTGPVNGYIEIGTTGRYLAGIRKEFGLVGQPVIINDVAPGHGLIDIAERGRLFVGARFVPLNDYQPIDPQALPAGTHDLISCYIGLHHAAPERLDGFIASIAALLRPGGVLVLREHDAFDAARRSFVSLAHTVYNAGLGVSWENNLREPRFFNGLPHWIDALARHGLVDSGQRLLQNLDPTANTLLAFIKQTDAQAAESAATPG